MQTEIERLRAAGFSEEDIQLYIDEEKNRAGQAQPVSPTSPAASADQPPAADETVPEYGRVDAPSLGTDLVTVGPALVADNMGKIAGVSAGGAALYGANQLRKGMAAQSASRDAMARAQMAQAEAAMKQAQGVQNRFDQRAAQQAARAAVPTSPILDAQGRPMVRPVAPAAMPTAAPMTPTTAPVAPEGFFGRAANAVSRYAAPLMKGLAVAGSAPVQAGLMGLTPSSTGPMVPSVGRMRGMEINPLTNAPWTEEQIRAYETNPQVFDIQLQVPQMPRS